MNDRGTEQPDEPEMVDVTAMPLGELLTCDESVLGHALRQVRIDVSRRHEVVAGHGSALVMES